MKRREFLQTAAGLAFVYKFAPLGHVFAMYAARQGGQGLRAEFSAPGVDYDRDGQPASFWRMRGSASLHEMTLVLTAVNTSVPDPIETQVLVRTDQRR